MVVGSTGEQPLPTGTEARLAGFTELAATAIASAQARVGAARIAEEQAALRRVAAPGGARGTAGGGFRRGHRGGRAAAGCAPRVDEPVRPRRHGRRWSPPGPRRCGRPPHRHPGGHRRARRDPLLFQTDRAVRLDDYAEATGPAGDLARTRASMRPSRPVSVAGRLWGLMGVASMRQRPARRYRGEAGRVHRLAATTIANMEARLELRGFAEEQAALRQVSMMVARGAVPEEIFAAVSAEAGRVLGADFTCLIRYDADNAARPGAWSGAPPWLPGRHPTDPGGRTIHTLVFQTGQPARIDDYTQATGRHRPAREYGLRSGAGVPVSVEGRLWGVMNVARTQEQPLPADIEARLAGFTELAATAVANAQTRTELRGFAAEQAALRRVAVLVARAAPPGEVFTAVAEEAGGLLGAHYTVLSRYNADGLVTVVGGWAKTDPDRPLAIGLPLKPEGRDIRTLVFETGQPARIDDYGNASGSLAGAAPDGGFRSSAGVPISVEGRLWGIMNVGSRAEPLPASTEARLAGFTELAATAIANAEAQAALTASRARIVAAAMPPAAGSSGTCTTEPSSGWSLSASSCARPRRPPHRARGSWPGGWNGRWARSMGPWRTCSKSPEACTRPS